MNLKKFINNKYLNKDFIKKKNKVILKNKPFNYISLDNFLLENKAEEIYETLNELDYYLEDHDLYQFLRTIHFKHIKNKKVEDILNKIFSEEFISYIEKLTSTKLDRNKKELHSLKFLNTHYLLCHDDKVQKRKIAFIINLSKKWTKKDGGELELFNVDENNNPIDVAVKVLPKFNQFNMFIVNEKSFHQVAEVLSNKERLSLAGWFYNN